MASLRASTHKSRAVRAFSLIELLVVMGIFIMVAGLGLVVSFDSFHGYTFRDERDTIVGALQKARSQAVNNMCFGACTDGRAHGVHLAGGVGAPYVVFQGTTFTAGDTINETISTKINSVSVTAADVVFSPLSGTVTGAPIVITVTDATHTSVITVESEGRIWWTN